MTNRLIKNTNNKDSRLLSFIVKLLLFVGVSIMIFTLFYLLFHLDTSDKIIYRCIPGFVLGLSSILLYGFFYHKKATNERFQI